MTDRKLGKTPAREGAVKLKFSDYLNRKAMRRAIPKHPQSFGHERALNARDWGMFANDRFGDCVWAGAAHETRLWTYEAGHNTWFTDKSVLQDYSDCTGFRADAPLVNGQNPTDNGTDMQKAAKYRKDIGLLDGHGRRHKIEAYLAINPGDLELHLDALYLFGAIGIGVELPNSAFDQIDRHQPWDPVSGSSIAGGHYIPAVAWRHDKLSIVTWGAIQPMTPQFLSKYNDESVVYLTKENMKDGKSPELFDYATLEAHLKALA